MAQTIAVVGKIGPAFGDGRPSHVELEFVTFDDQSNWTRISNWPSWDRADAMRAAFDQVEETVTRDGDFAGADYSLAMEDNPSVMPA